MAVTTKNVNGTAKVQYLSLQNKVLEMKLEFLFTPE